MFPKMPKVEIAQSGLATRIEVDGARLPCTEYSIERLSPRARYHKVTLTFWADVELKRSGQ